MSWGSRWLSLLILCVTFLLPLSAQAALKLIVVVRDIRFEGTQVAVSLELRPFGLDARGTKLPLIARANVDPATCAADLKTFIINRVQTEYSVTLVASEIVVMGGCQ